MQHLQKEKGQGKHTLETPSRVLIVIVRSKSAELSAVFEQRFAVRSDELDLRIKNE